MAEILKAENLVIIALGMSGLVFGSIGMTMGAVFTAVFLLSDVYRKLMIKNGGVVAVGVISSFAILLATTLYVFGQYAQLLRHFTVRLTSFACLILFCLKGEKSIARNHFKANFALALTFSIITFFHPKSLRQE